MRTERRHELKTNDLSTFLAELNEWTKKNASNLGIGAIVVLAVVVGLTYVSRSAESAADKSRLALQQLSFAKADADTSFEEIDRLISDSKDRDFRMNALLRKASAALNLANTEPDQFNTERLNRAKEAFEQLVQGYPERIPVLASALSGLVTVEEDLFVLDGEMEHRGRAKELLERLQNEPRFKGTPFQTNAAERLKRLDETFRVIALAPPLPKVDTPSGTVDMSSADQMGTVKAGEGITVRRLDGPPPGIMPEGEVGAKAPLAEKSDIQLAPRQGEKKPEPASEQATPSKSQDADKKPPPEGGKKEP